MRAASSGGSSNELLSEVRWLQWVFWEDESPLPTTNLLDLSWSGIKRRLQRICICRISQCCVLGDDPPLPTTGLHLPNLLVLDLSESWDITEDWEAWRSSFMTAKRLRVLDLSGCPNLRCSPDLSAFTQLKILTFNDCRRLKHLHPSIGKLKSLVSLDLSWCQSLKGLPEEVGELTDLEELVLNDSGITEIPTSIGSLRKLKTLNAYRCKSLREIPSSIGDLQNLPHLDLSYCESLREIPSSIGDLRNLQHLDLSCSGIEKLPSAIGRLKNLRTLSLQECSSLKGPIPSEIGDLSSLEVLNFTRSPISDLPESIRNLSSLRRLYLGRWLLPEQLPTGLTYLQVTCQSSRLPHLSSLIHLEKLRLWECHLLEDIPELPSRLLKLCIEECGKLILLKLDGLKNLEELSIEKCSSIERLDLSQSIRLKRLCVANCDEVVEIQGLNNLEFLEDISIDYCDSIERLLCPESTCLKKLEACGCDNLVEIRGLDGAKFLEKLDIKQCKSLETLPNLMRCEKLRSLNVRNCEKLTQLRGLEKLDLIGLDISGCNSLETIPKLSGTRVFRNY